jgi:hypothetical protein
MSFAISNKAHVCFCGHTSAQLADQSSHDELADAPTLMFGLNGHIHDLEEESAVADHSAHPDDPSTVLDNHAKKRVR